MTTTRNRFDPSTLCSRKLWQLVSSEPEASVNEIQLRQAIAELTTRRHYLAELSQMGKLESTTHNA
jgi:hypothetical protein